MAKMLPLLSEEQLNSLPSRAEARFYRACRDQLPDDVIAIHSASWLYRDQTGRMREGEADFTLASPRSGILAIEIKGGGIAFDALSGQWSSIDRHGQRHEIKDPFKQASRERYAILDQLTGHSTWRQWRGKRLTIGHAVMLPDLYDTKAIEAPSRPKDIIGINKDMAKLDSWFEQVMKFWKEDQDDKLGDPGIRLLEEILCKSVEVLPILRSTLDDTERHRIRLTKNQSKVLRIIGGRRRAVISGGAGTGKTLIAAEKARQLAENGLSTLLLCYNRPLADTLSRNLAEIENLSVMSFHQLCEHRMSTVRVQLGRDLIAEACEAYPGNAFQHKFEVQMPFALALSNEVLDEKYDAVVVDEAQDFSDEYWFAVTELLKQPDDGFLYLFIDQNQALYKRHANLPIQDEPFHLTANCRNTEAIHKLGYVHYTGEPVDCPDLQGPDVEWSPVEGASAQAAMIGKQVRQLLTVQKLEPSEVAVLLAKRPKAPLYDLLSHQTLPGNLRWAFESHLDRNAVLVDTVARFKGLEAPAVILWVGDEIVDEKEWETIYVGTTRAKSVLSIVATNKAITAIQSFKV